MHPSTQPRLARAFLTVSAYACLGAASIHAASSDVLIKHRTENGKIEVQHKGPVGRFAPGETVKLRARHGEQVNLVIADPNTLVFSYKLGERSEANVADFEALKKLAEAMEGIFTSNAPAAVEKNFKTTAVSKAPTTVTVGGVTIVIKTFAESVSKLAEELDKVPGAVRVSLTRAITPADFDAETAEAAVTQVDQLLKFFGAMEVAMLDPDTKSVTFGGASHAPLSPGEFWAEYPKLKSIFDVRVRLRALTESLRAFLADFHAYERALAGAVRVGTVVGSNQKDITQSVIISANGAYAGDAAVKKDQDAHTGTYTFVVSPEQSFHYRISAGVVYSFVRNPEYSVASGDNGVLKIAEKSADYNEISGAVALNVYPDRWFDEGVKWFGQIGASPAKNLNALFLGAGFNAFDKFTLASGIIYQQRRELGNGQSVGMTLAKAEDLTVRHKFASGLYVLVGVSF